MSRYDDEPFLLWFTRPTPTWLDLSAEARGVAISVAMEIGLGKSGGITLRKGLRSLETLIRIPWEKLEPAIAELVAAGKLTWDGSKFFLFDPEYAERKRKTSADRMRDLRARKSDARDVTSVTAVTDTTRDAGDVTSNLISSDLILDPDQDLKSTGSAKTDPSTRPSWFDDACDTVEMQTGETIDRPAAWLGYYGHRASPESAKGMSRPDALYWLTKVDVRDAKKDRQAAADKRAREAKWDRDRERQRGPAPGDPPPKPTAAESKAFADELARRMAERKAREKGAA